MLYRYRRGSTETLNRHRGLKGELTVDLEAMGLRLHDGQTPGGFQALGTQAVETPPGPPSLQKGTEQLGYYGVFDGEELITGPDLIALCGISFGLQGTQPTRWLKFAYQGKTIYYATQHILSQFSFDEIISAGVGIGKTITLGKFTYRVRLPYGFNANPYPSTASNIQGSEWNELLYRVGSKEIRGGTEEFDALSAVELGIAEYPALSMVGETSASYTTSSGYRGAINTLESNVGYKRTERSSSRGWRPVLELID